MNTPMNGYHDYFVKSHHLIPMESALELTPQEFSSALFVGLYLGHAWARVLSPFRALAIERLKSCPRPWAISEVWSVASQCYEHWDDQSAFDYPIIGGFSLRKRIYWHSLPSGNLYVGVSRPPHREGDYRLPIECLVDSKGEFKMVGVHEDVHERHIAALAWIPTALRSGRPFENSEYPVRLNEVRNEIASIVRESGFKVLPDE